LRRYRLDPRCRADGDSLAVLVALRDLSRDVRDETVEIRLDDVEDRYGLVEVRRMGRVGVRERHRRGSAVAVALGRRSGGSARGEGSADYERPRPGRASTGAGRVASGWGDGAEAEADIERRDLPPDPANITIPEVVEPPTSMKTMAMYCPVVTGTGVARLIVKNAELVRPDRTSTS